ncbi:MAG TPA: hypothetical protein VLB09_02720, partial [Nitrospiria bacterium]|nr:hypothetical protein [Nitrospiria bacterium]
LRTGVFPNVTWHNIGVGVLGQGFFEGQVNDPLGSRTLDVHLGYDIALVVSGAYAFFDESLQAGLTGKLVTRRSQERGYTILDLVQQDGIDLSDLESETGFGLDLGFIYKLPFPVVRPTIGAAIQNIGDLDLGEGGTIDQRINIGFGARPTILFGEILLALDFVDITRNAGEDEDLGKRIHAGVEYRFPMIASLRLGLNQGYPSYGAGLDFWMMRFEYAFYIEEIGAHAGQRADRRNIFQFTIGL